MKKFLVLLIALCLLLCGCSSKSSDAPEIEKGQEKYIIDATDALIKFWKTEYSESGISDNYLEIKNTRIITIKDNSNEYFSDIECIVEFVLFSNYYDTAPYYTNVGTNDCVIFYKDGTVEVSPNYFNLYRNYTYSTDFNDVIDTIYDFEHYFNRVVIG